MERSDYSFNTCIVRPVARSIEQALRLEEPDTPIQFEVAKKQHQKYTEILKSLIPNVIELPEESELPDSCFVEDCAVVIEQTVLIPIPGAPSRRAEVQKIKETFESLKMNIITMQSPATLDGGDYKTLPQMSADIFVGLSRRTNEEGVKQLTAAFPSYKTYPIPVTEGLHLKSVMSAFDRDTLLVGDCPLGRKIVDEIKCKTCLSDPNRYTFVFLPEIVAANILRVGDTIVVQEKCTKSLEIIRELAKARNVKVVTVDQSELWKVDGALTCCSILFNR